MIADFCSDNTRKPGTLEFPEVLFYVGKRVNEDQEDAEMKEAFEFFDRNGDKRISPDELRSVLKETLKQHISEAELDAMMKQADADDDGLISFEEFKLIMS